MQVLVNIDDYRSESIAEEIAADLRMRILHGTITAGTKLREIELSKRYNSSRTPIREAFRILQQENLISYSPFVGVTTIALTQKFLEDSGALRRVLESFAVELGIINITEKDMVFLAGLKEKMAYMEPDNTDEFNALNQMFHLMLGQMSKNRELEKAIIRAWNSTLSFRTLSMEQYLPDRIASASLEHINVIQAMLNRNITDGVKYLHEHFDRSLERNKKCVQGMDPALLDTFEEADTYGIVINGPDESLA